MNIFQLRERVKFYNEKIEERVDDVSTLRDGGIQFNHRVDGKWVNGLAGLEAAYEADIVSYRETIRMLEEAIEALEGGDGVGV